MELSQWLGSGFESLRLSHAIHLKRMRPEVFHVENSYLMWRWRELQQHVSLITFLQLCVMTATPLKVMENYHYILTLVPSSSMLLITSSFTYQNGHRTGVNKYVTQKHIWVIDRFIFKMSHWAFYVMHLKSLCEEGPSSNTRWWEMRTRHGF